MIDEAIQLFAEQTGETPYSRAWYAVLRRALGDSLCRQLGIYAIPDEFTLSVVIPIFNEQQTLARLVERVCRAPLRKQVILVDDGSTDGTWQTMQQLEAGELNSSNNQFTLARHEENRGKGAALRTAFSLVRGDAVIVQDADLEYDPAEYPRLLQPIVEDRADVVYGSRFLGDQPHRVLYFWHYVGNRTVTTLSNCFTNLNLTDMETCFKAMRRRVVDEIAPQLRENRFGIEPELTARIARRKYRVFEMSVSYAGRTYEQGKKITWRDGVAALWKILRYGLAD